jgi:hypothetical protein
MTPFEISLSIFLIFLLIAGNTLCLEFMKHTDIKLRWRRVLAIPPFMMITVFLFGLWTVISEFSSWLYNTIKSFITE